MILFIYTQNIVLQYFTYFFDYFYLKQKIYKMLQKCH